MKSLFFALFLTSLAFGQGDLMDSLVIDSVDNAEPDSIPVYEIIVTAQKSLFFPVTITPVEKEEKIGLTNDIHDLQKYLPGIAASGQQANSYSVEGSDYSSNLMVLNDIQLSFPSHLGANFPKNSSVLNMASVKSLNFITPRRPRYTVSRPPRSSRWNTRMLKSPLKDISISVPWMSRDFRS